MALDNLISMDLSTEEVAKIDDCLAMIENVIAGKIIALHPEERNQYGKVGESTQVWISKINDYMASKPETIPAFINQKEFDKDLSDRTNLMPRIARLHAIANGLEDTSILLGADLYNAALAYYNNIKLLNKQNVPGAKLIYEDLNQKFPGRPKSMKPKTVSAV